MPDRPDLVADPLAEPLPPAGTVIEPVVFDVDFRGHLRWFIVNNVWHVDTTSNFQVWRGACGTQIPNDGLARTIRRLPNELPFGLPPGVSLCEECKDSVAAYLIRRLGDD